MIRRLPFIFALLSLLACSHQPTSSLPVRQMKIGSQTFSLEIATNVHDQEVGLMHRDHLDPDHGMLFVFSSEQSRSFWNEDVHFSLDLIFLNSSGMVVSIKRLDAYNARAVGSDANAQYAIELNAGTAARLNLKVGDGLTLPTNLPPAVVP